MACHPGPHGEAPESVGRQKGARGKPRLSLYWGFRGVAHPRQNRLNRLAGLNKALGHRGCAQLSGPWPWDE